MRHWRTTVFFPWAVLAGSLLLTLATVVSVERASHAHRQGRFDSVVQTTVERIDARMNTYAALLQGAAGLFAANPPVSRAAFHEYVEHLLLARHYPGTLGVGYSPRVQPGQREALVSQARAEGLAGFRIWPEAEREPLFTILYLEPANTRNRAAMGFNMFSEAVRREAMERARDTGALVLSGKVTLKQEIDVHKQAGFLLYLPLYSGRGVPATALERQAALLGFVYAPLRADDLFAGILGSDKHPDVVFRVHDGEAVTPEALLHASDARAPGEGSALSTVRRLSIAGRLWTVTFVAAPGFVASSDRMLPPTLGLLGVLVSLALFGLTRTQARARAEAEEQRTLFDLVIEGSGDGIIMSDEAGVLRIFNPAAQRQHGASKQQVSAPEWAKTYGLFSPEGKPLPLEETPLFKALRGTASVNATWMVKRQDGQLRTLMGTAMPLRRPDGSPAGAVLISRDETEKLAQEAERARTHEALQHSEERYKLATRATKDAIWDWDLLTGSILWTEGVYELFGYTQEEVRPGEAWWQDTIHPEDRERVVQGISAALGNGARSWHDEYRFRRKDGTYAHVTDRGLVHHDADGKAVRVVGAMQDISAKKLAEEARERLIKSLERSNAELDQFAYVASHDLKAPLRGIASLAQWLEEDLGDQVTADARKHLDLIRGRVHRMEALIEGILDYSRAGRVRSKPERVDVGRLLKDSIELLNPAEPARVEVAADMPTFHSERTPLQQVFLNLIGNALKYAGRPDVLVRVGFQDLGDGYAFSVADNGRGIAPEYHEKIWGIFQRLEARDKVEGTGIGLSVVKKAVESRGGKVWLESAEGQGSTFYFTWPKRAQEG